jgi:DNA repair protein RadA/Sms
MNNATIIVCWRCEEKFQARRAQCPSCRAWNVPKPSGTINKTGSILLSDVEDGTLERRLVTGPWDVCFGAHPVEHGEEPEYGIVNTSVTLIGGSPGAGKSTMSLQLTDRIAGALNTGIHSCRKKKQEIKVIAPCSGCELEKNPRETLYICTEQSPKEIKMYARRMQLENFNRIRLIPMGTQFAMSMLENLRPAAVVLDSLSGLTSDMDLQAWVCKQLKLFAVKHECPVIVITHVTKGEDFAGKMDTQHDVDTLLTLYPKEEIPCRWCDDPKCRGCLRELWTEKNRWGKAQISVKMRMTVNGFVEHEDEDED